LVRQEAHKRPTGHYRNGQADSLGPPRTIDAAGLALLRQLEKERAERA
jgi:hypothetical protein